MQFFRYHRSKTLFMRRDLRGYVYAVRRDRHGNHAITAGCRTWFSVRAMRRHYNVDWRRMGSNFPGSCMPDDHIRQMYRTRCLTIADQIEKFCIKKRIAALLPKRRAKSKIRKTTRKTRAIKRVLKRAA